MGLLSMIEDRPTPKAVYNWRVYTSAAVTASAAMMIGYDSAFIGGSLALKSFQTEFNFGAKSPAERNLLSANIVSCYQAGAFFGAFFAYPAGHYLGRKYGLAILAAIFCLGAGLMLGASGSTGLGYLYGGRVIAGLAIGGASNLAPIYCSEISPPAIRGRLVGLYEMAWQIGGLVGFWINYGVSETLPSKHEQWIIPFAVQLIPGGLLFATIFFIKESPRWLFSRGRREEGIRNLAWIRNLSADHIYMQEEITAMDLALEHTKATIGTDFWAPFKAVAASRVISYRFFLGCSLFFWQNATGINAINYYSPTVFKSIGVQGTNTSLLTTGIFGVIKTTVTVVWLLYLIDRVGRRGLLMFGAVSGSICMWYIAAYIAIAQPTKHVTANLSSGGKSAMAFFYLWTACYTPSWNGTPWVLNSEMFDQNVRTLAQACAAASNWLFNFLVARFTPQMFAAMGFGVYMFFASLMLCAFVYVYFLVPETKGIPLEAMDRLFSGGIPARKAHKIVLAEVQSEEQEFRRASVADGKIDEAGYRIDGKHIEQV